jgi:hypothetical protein
LDRFAAIKQDSINVCYPSTKLIFYSYIVHDLNVTKLCVLCIFSCFTGLDVYFLKIKSIKLTNSIELSTTQEATSCAATQLSQHFMESKGSLPHSQGSPLFPILSQTNPVHTTLDHFNYTWRRVHITKLLITQFLHPPVTSSLFCPNILLSTLFLMFL